MKFVKSKKVTLSVVTFFVVENKNYCFESCEKILFLFFLKENSS